ncbi:putative bZIP transcription factor AP-1/Yap1 [Aspergillus clavatus NRRL 1]|uniref:BZIP transcription factor (AP-1), putative n=1 Tax=Aspergillus clavatus (strain ATCC 1007 / CBS 513.65 / DSM 816 / NCTC 3887 / NRRL 1 / QM 1276 / 107) TaxID=344612 RepID=A1CTG9_ASPCL|nr:bZIP transcription factor (AP-1), putative [Aspergillus clavatus NRRL 1]EAW06606.1 bZIP transcription factor (AP-1), putative [Aspergillus clavatus NRRL 1]
MADYNTLYQQGLYLTPDQQDLLLAAFSTANPQKQPNTSQHKVDSNSDPNHTPGHTSSGSFSVSPSGRMDGSGNHSSTFGYDDSPFLDFNPDLDLDFLDNENLIGDLPPSLPSTEDYEPGDKRKDIDGPEDEKEESGKKRRESDEKAAKKPGRKPLTSEPTSKRKAQNRAAQRAFRERKEKHLKDLEAKVDELQKASDNASQENGLLRAHVERLQVELKEYRKRLSWVTTGSGLSPMNAIPAVHSRAVYNGVNNNDFLFDFPKFGDLPGSHIFHGRPGNSPQSSSGDSRSARPRNDAHVPGVLNRNALNSPTTSGTPSANSSSNVHSPASQTHTKSTAGTSVGTDETNGTPRGYTPKVNSAYTSKQTSHDTPSSDSPSSSSDSHHSQLLSSSGTSPEPSTHSPAVKAYEGGNNHTCTYSTVGGEESFCAQLGMACGNINNPIPAVKHNSESATNTPAHANPTDQLLGLDLLAQQNGGQFDPVLFGDWREPQDAILSQDFGTFFDDAFPLPDLGSPSHNLTEVVKQPAPPKKDLIAEIDSRLEEDDEVVPGEDKSQMLTCSKIWDRLQSMEKFRNGEIDVDNLCSELRTKARCSEGGVVVNQQDVDDIMGRVK